MSEHNTSRAIRYLPQVAVATAAVAVMPVVVVWWLRAEAILTSPWVCAGLAIALSLAASVAGSAFWKRCPGSGDVFFSELLLWGWLHRFRGERRLAKTVERLGLGAADAELPAGDVGVERKSELLREMAAALDAQDPYTDGHSRRVALHCVMVGRKLGLGRDELANVRTAAAVHDIGKLRIPMELLNKPSELSDAEFDVVKSHAYEGAEIVSCMDHPDVTAMVRHHHEHFDGSGYPAALEGEQIPLGARIISVADTFDALTSERSYRNAIPHKRALDVIEAVSGTQLDPVVVRAFLRCYSANRAVLFWTILAVSPQRALAWVRGKGPGHASFSSAATVATPAMLAAVVTAVFGTTVGIAPARDPFRVAQGMAPAPPSGAPAPKHHSVRAQARPRILRTSASASRQAVLGTRQIRHSTPQPFGGHSQLGANGGSQSSRGTGQTSGGSGNPTAAGPGAQTSPSGGGHPPNPSPAPKPVKPIKPTGAPSPPSAGASTPPAGPAPSGTPTPTTGPGSPPPNPGGAGGGGSGGPGAGGSGGGPGGGGSGAGQPTSKDACKNGGYAEYGFSNQGQCVAFVERGPQP